MSPVKVYVVALVHVDQAKPPFTKYAGTYVPCKSLPRIIQ